MSWRNQLRPASFRGVPFFTKSTNGQVGRRTVLHEYPQRDTPYAEDMGRKARGFTVTGYVVGKDYMAARDKLVAALEQPGSGELVHPYWGAMQVVLAQPASVEEQAAEGGMARFTMMFAESGAWSGNQSPVIKADTVAQVSKSADAAKVAISKDFGHVHNLSGAAAYVSKASSDLTQKIFSTINNITGQFPIDPNGAAELALSLVGSAAAVATLIQNPSLLTQAILAPITGLRAFALDPNSSFGVLSSLFDFGASGTPSSVSPVVATTPQSTQQMANQAALINLVRRAALVEAAVASSEISYSSSTDAAKMLKSISQLLDDEMMGIAASIAPLPTASGQATTELSDDVYMALRDLRVAVVNDITARGANLAPLITWTPPSTMPVLLIAQMLYGNADMTEDIIARNKIKNPLFAPGGVALEVLANV